MIRIAWRRIVGLLSSAGLALGLLVFVGVWSLLATLVPQGAPSSPGVTAWASAYPLIGPITEAMGLHAAFTSHVFLAAVVLLGIATAVCAWRRTKVALSRSATLRSARHEDAGAVAGRHDLEITCDAGLSAEDILSAASDALSLEGIRVKRGEDVLAAVSSPWTVWGSTVFHWALVALILTIFFGQMVRSEGSMLLAVGEGKPDAPASYASVQAGVWRGWDREARTIRVDAFEPDLKIGGIDRGAVPTVSVLDEKGAVLVKQRVYPNSMLHSGSLAINAPDCGLSVWLASVDASGTESARIIRYVDFSQRADGGTVPVGVLTSTDAAGKLTMLMTVTVPLDRVGDGYGEWVPAKRTAHLVVTTADGEPLIDRIVVPDENVALPGGGSVRLLGVGWYSRLALVDDPTIPFIYAAMIIAMIGLTMTVVFRQQLLLATVVAGPEGQLLVMRLRLWRNTSTNRSEIEQVLTRALRSNEEEGQS